MAKKNKPSAMPFPGRRIGLLGGSFNPAHKGHREICIAAMQRLQLDAVWWLVSPQNPLKPTKGMKPLSKRMKSARKRARHPRIWVTDIETTLGTQYSVDTIRKLQRRFPERRFVWLIGADNLSQLPAWRNWTEIFASIPVAVLARPNYSQNALAGRAARRYRKARFKERMAPLLPNSTPPAWVFLQTPLNSVSSTAIRILRTEKKARKKAQKKARKKYKKRWHRLF